MSTRVAAILAATTALVACGDLDRDVIVSRPHRDDGAPRDAAPPPPEGSVAIGTARPSPSTQSPVTIGQGASPGAGVPLATATATPPLAPASPPAPETSGCRLDGGCSTGPHCLPHECSRACPIGCAPGTPPSSTPTGPRSNYRPWPRDPAP